MTILTTPVRRVEGLFLEDYTASPGAYLGARAQEAWERNPFPSGARVGEIEQAEGPDPTTELVESMEGLSPPRPALSPLLSAEEATDRGSSVGLKFSKPTRAEVVDIMIRRKKAEVARQSVMRRSPGGFGLEATAIGTELFVTAADPLNVVASFIPVVREARFAAWARSLGPTAARLGRGAVEGAVGAALVEPLVLTAATQEQADYDMMDSLLNVAFGTALGGGLHVGGGALSDAIARRMGGLTLSERLQQAPLEVREAALRTAVAQSIEGRQVNVEPLLTGSRLLDETSLSTRTQRFEPQVTPEGVSATTELQARRDAESTTFVPLESRRGERRVYKTEDAARRAADKRRDNDIQIAANPDGDGFVLRRRSDVQPIREPGGSVRAFPNERQARRFIDRTVAPDERKGLEIVPFGKAPNREYAIVRNASERDLSVMRAKPDLVRFPEVRQDRVTRQEPPALLTSRNEPTLNERIDAAVKHGRDPRSIAVADFRAAEHANEVLKQIPATERSDVAQQFVDDALEQVDELRRALQISDEDFGAIVGALDDQVAEAESLGRAARAAALCELRQ